MIRPGLRVLLVVGFVFWPGIGLPYHSNPEIVQNSLFLESPYYGTALINAVFDHQFPMWNDGNANVIHYDGTVNGPGARLNYDEHRGIDYNLFYTLIRASASGTVAQAGWADTDHRAGLGLYVRISHSENVDSLYGHLSTIRARQGDVINVQESEFRRVIGTSGNTGRAYGYDGSGMGGACTNDDPATCGAHFHFQVEVNDVVVDPYGWIGTYPDPWAGYDSNRDGHPEGMVSVNRFVQYPSVHNPDVYPSGNPVPLPPVIREGDTNLTIDDGDNGFSGSPGGCWGMAYSEGWNGDYLYRTVPGANCTATWTFPQNQAGGLYHVFIYVPNRNVLPGQRLITIDSASYLIHHTDSGSHPAVKKDERVILNQWVYPNEYHTSRWAYAGTYYFDSNEYGLDYIRSEVDTLGATGVMAADAIRFVKIDYRFYLPNVERRYPPIPDMPVLEPIQISGRQNSYTVQWRSAYLANSYALQEARTADFRDAVLLGETTQTLWNIYNRQPGTYYYRIKARNQYGETDWTAPQSVTVEGAHDWTRMMQQDFEGNFPELPWRVSTNASGYTWGRRNCRSAAGSFSAWVAGGGSRGGWQPCGNSYPNNTNVWMYYGPFSLAGATDARLDFSYWINMQDPDDKLFYAASIDGSNFYGNFLSLGSGSWRTQSLDLKNIPGLGNLTGRSSVWIAFIFISDSAQVNPEGVYVDRISLSKCEYSSCEGSLTLEGAEIPLGDPPSGSGMLVLPADVPDPWPF